MNVTEVPAQMAPVGSAAMPTLAGSRGLTVITTVFDVAGLSEAHARFDVITT